jgi:KaiC/GvpD/RAD55 family RecA-like ATPase
MSKMDTITAFYSNQLPDGELKNNILQAPCPFCTKKDAASRGQLIVFLNPDSFFHGYFRCQNHCVPGGFPLYFSRLLGLNMMTVPGYDPDREYASAHLEYPVKNINADIQSFMGRMTEEQYEHFSKMGISQEILKEMEIGYNGRYLVYPYIEDDGNCYCARCIHPDRPEDNFWYGDEEFVADRIMVFNNNDIDRCENGILIVVESEDNLLTIKQLGLPGIAVTSATNLEKLNPEELNWITTVFLWANNGNESQGAARTLATRLGFKARLIRWPEHTEKNYSLVKLSTDLQKEFQQSAFKLIKESRAFSPFSSPEKEFLLLSDRLRSESGDAYKTMQSGFAGLDDALGGIHGINIVGGTPKAGKSCFFIQIATDMARRKIPVIYYDFENGRQKIYQRTLCRLSSLSVEQIKDSNRDQDQTKRLQKAKDELRALLPWFKVVTDRKLTPEIMRRHIDFFRHERKNQYTLVVIDSLHKLPFKNLSERRTGIDAWLRELEAIRDELNVSFLVISELSRGKDDQYDAQPHMGSFKGTGDIEYSADNAMVLMPDWNSFDSGPLDQRTNSLWLVASREQSPGKIADYRLDYPYWGFEEKR